MTRLKGATIILLSLLVPLVFQGCAVIKDIRTDTIPMEVYQRQIKVSHEASIVLNSLEIYLNNPKMIPEGAHDIVFGSIYVISNGLRKNMIWMRENGVEEGVVDSMVDMISAWDEYIAPFFCHVDTGWLVTKAPISIDDYNTWLKSFKVMRALHQTMYLWMEDKGVIDG